MKWGSRYGPEFVNRLYSSIKRHTKKRTAFYCFTDNSEGICREIICKPLPNINLPEKIAFSPWRKMCLWQNPLYELKGDVLVLDLDLVITGDIDRFFDYKPGHYCVIENWTQIGQNIGNTSCFRIPIGRYESIFKKFHSNPYKYWKKYHIEQVYLSNNIRDQIFWPTDWCKSFKHDLLPKWPWRIWEPAKLPKETSIVAFTGKPDPDDVIKGNWPIKKYQFYKKIYKQLRTPKWVLENWL